MRQPATASPRIGIWGTFDLENYGDLLFPRIAERELLRRLPAASVHPYAPYGRDHPIRLEIGRPPEPLGVWSFERRAELAAALDCVLVGGGEIIHTKDELLAPHYGVSSQELRNREPSRFFIDGLGRDLERTCPVIWHAVGIPMESTPAEADRFRAALAHRPYVAVRGETSRRRLRDAGVEGEIAVVPDSAFLLPRLFPPDLLERRVDHLCQVGWYPRDRNALVLQGSRPMIASVPLLAQRIGELLQRRGDLVPVLIGTGPSHGDHEFADALSAALTRPAFRLPEGALVEDLVAAIWGARAFVGVSMHASITAFCFGKPHVVLNAVDYSKLLDLGQLIENPACVISDVSAVDQALDAAERAGNRAPVLSKLQSRVDSHFDRIVELAVRVDARRGRKERGWLRNQKLRERAAIEHRFAFTEAVSEARARQNSLSDDVADLEAQVRALESQLEVLQASRSLRLTAPLRTLRWRLRSLRALARWSAPPRKR